MAILRVTVAMLLMLTAGFVCAERPPQNPLLTEEVTEEQLRQLRKDPPLLILHERARAQCLAAWEQPDPPWADSLPEVPEASPLTEIDAELRYLADCGSHARELVRWVTDAGIEGIKEDHWKDRTVWTRWLSLVDLQPWSLAYMAPSYMEAEIEAVEVEDIDGNIVHNPGCGVSPLRYSGRAAIHYGEDAVGWPRKFAILKGSIVPGARCQSAYSYAGSL